MWHTRTRVHEHTHVFRHMCKSCLQFGPSNTLPVCRPWLLFAADRTDPAPSLNPRHVHTLLLLLRPSSSFLVVKATARGCGVVSCLRLPWSLSLCFFSFSQGLVWSTVLCMLPVSLSFTTTPLCMPKARIPIALRYLHATFTFELNQMYRSLSHGYCK